jgi:hypothetical protein
VTARLLATPDKSWYKIQFMAPSSGTVTVLVRYNSVAIGGVNPQGINITSTVIDPVLSRIVCPTVGTAGMAATCNMTIRSQSGLVGDASLASAFIVTVMNGGKRPASSISLESLGMFTVSFVPTAKGEATLRV